MSMLTEGEAKTKWCPLLRMIPATVDHHATTTRGETMTVAHPHVNSTCVGSACMAWRWKMVSANMDHPFLEERKPSSKGFCGAFGRPEQ